jgi:hypothetical protein
LLVELGSRDYVTFMKRLAISLSALTVMLFLQMTGNCLAREQYQMTQPPGPPPSAPIGSSAAQASLVTPVPVGADFWATGGGGMLANSLAEGTVLTGILQEDISSNKSNAGDVFSLVLPYGGQSNGKQIVPPGSKIIGVIKSVTPAKSLKFGQPGSLEVSLQSLVLPDGRSIRFHGFIDHNANLDPRVQPKVKTAGPHFSDYGSYAKSFLLQFPAGLGSAMNARHRGADYSLQQGVAIPVRVTSNIGLPPPLAPPMGYPRPVAVPPPPGYQQSLSSMPPETGLVPGQTYPQYNPASAASSLRRIAPGGNAPEPGYLPAGPQLRSELGTQPAQQASGETPSNMQGIHATPLTLDNNY